jgi:hypothetical protein
MLLGCRCSSGRPRGRLPLRTAAEMAARGHLRATNLACFPRHGAGSSCQARGRGGLGGMGGHAGCQPGVEAGGKASLPLPLPPARRGAPPVLMSLLLPLAPGGRSARPRYSLHIRQHREGRCPRPRCCSCSRHCPPASRPASVARCVHTEGC